MALAAGMIHLLKIEDMKILLPFCQRLLGTSQKFAGAGGGGEGGGVETEGGSQRFETQKREGS